jgi:hypothetical protein
MEVLSHLVVALGRTLLWICSVLAIEELMLGGLARIFLSMPYDGRGKRRRMRRNAAAPGSKDVGNR